METIFKIVKFEKNDDIFIKIGYDEFKITYLKGLKVHQLRIVVNGFLTKQNLNLVSFKEGYKNKILSAIKEYVYTDESIKSKNVISKNIKIHYIKAFYSPLVVKNIQQYLININKEESRDKLTEFGLINLQ